MDSVRRSLLQVLYLHYSCPNYGNVSYGDRCLRFGFKLLSSFSSLRGATARRSRSGSDEAIPLLEIASLRSQ
ncbi:MAG: hypothetical protein A3I73_01020 [Omnitrophica bacterium RIFCSPLOWO2_02_FULL_45_16]|nr:MAG: hypothetical protein A3C51_01530 [Omnitrophica bacterium RIFCSPHIGHO2_02_FULL_46_20]OGW93330.1 MAG: hypothetical protein A3K16_04050 [Omnitrophica bacterium RIFCSPLOWO2_01_FULL_45_24]OGW99909.1 MAG: hypothetical protein A3I73_01020 [Omnitrophica bacterium RIFCSPLOWO2_02_FULL_45_16]